MVLHQHLRILGDHDIATEGVHRVEAALGHEPDTHSERMAASLAQLARASGLQRIDHVVLGNVGAQGVHNVFAVQGALEDPAHRRVHMPAVQDHQRTALTLSPSPDPAQVIEAPQRHMMG